MLSVGLPQSAPAQEPPAIPPELQDIQTTISIRADSQQKVKDTYYLRGHVAVTFREMKLTADEANFDESTGEVVARGRVTFTAPEAHFEADEAHYSLRSGRGWFSNGHG